jgi:hypothetical protein
VSQSKKRVYLREKTVPLTKTIPVYSTKNVSDPRELYVDTRTDGELLAELEAEQKAVYQEFQVQIDALKRRIEQNKRVSTRPDDWKYKSKTLRTTYFDERKFVDGRVPNVPRVVTVVFTHDRDNGVTRFGAVQWTPGHPGDEFNRYEQRMIATKRYSSSPIIVRLEPIPKTVYEVQCCLRWMIHELGVQSYSKAFERWAKRQNESQAHRGRQILKTPLAAVTTL